MLRDYQKQIVEQCSCAYVEGKKGVILQMPTGGGKTAASTHIVKQYAKTGRQTLWLVHRQELLLQAAMTYAKNGLNHRLICSKNVERKIKVIQFKQYGRDFVDNSSNNIISSVQTLIRRLDCENGAFIRTSNCEKPLNPVHIIADECHLSLNNTFRKIIGAFPNARLLGLTATPIREDGQVFNRNRHGLYDELVQGPQVYDLIEQGFLSDYELYSPPISLINNEKIRTKGGDYDSRDLAEEFANSIVYGDVVNHYAKYSHNLPAIGFCPTVSIARQFTEKFKEVGYKAECLDGKTEDSARWKILNDLAEGRLHVVMSVDVLIEGTDVPLATTALLLRKTKSLRIYLQSIGRVMRPHPKKKCALIMDFVGLTQTHGFPDDHREWTLEGKTTRKRRPNDSLEESVIVRVKTCPECFRDHDPSPKCPSCGHIYAIDEKEATELQGSLIRVTRQNKEQLEEARLLMQKTRRLEESECRKLDDWVKLAKDRGYKFPIAWAKKRYELRCRGRV